MNKTHRFSLLLCVLSLLPACTVEEDHSDQALRGADLPCKPDDCGPPLGMPNVLCPDGVNVSGPGECVDQGGYCGWEILTCPDTACGGFLGLPCPEGQECVDDPNDDCDPEQGGADCIGICIAPEYCGGFAGLECSNKGDVCVDDPSDDCDPDKGGADCIGICTTPEHKLERTPEYCGGFAGLECSNEGDLCIDDPSDNCNPGKGGADCIGICITPEYCGGFAGIECSVPEDVCVDDPSDDCDPNKGGADCIGICMPG